MKNFLTSLLFLLAIGPLSAQLASNYSFKNTSVLQDGALFKMSITTTGLYKLSYDYLKDELGVDIDNIDPRNIQIFSNKGGLAPEIIGDQPLDDLLELPILIEGEADGSFDNNDYLIFYAQGPDVWRFNEELGYFDFEKNIYDEENYVFLKIGNNEGSRVEETPNLSTTNPRFNSFDDFKALEEEKVNLLHFWGETTGKAQGSGRIWYGDHFRNLRSYTYDQSFNFPNLVRSEPIHINARMALRAVQRSTFSISIDNQTLTSARASRVVTLSGTNDNINNYANTAILQGTTSASSDNISVTVEYPYPQSTSDGSEGWLDYIYINAKRALVMEGASLAFQVIASKDNSQNNYAVNEVNSSTIIWNISKPLEPNAQAYSLGGSTLIFGTNHTTGEVERFVAFNPDQVTNTPTALGSIPNQNLHAISDIDMLIVASSELLAEAEVLANHRREYSKLSVAVVDADQVYNEFASGRREPTAIRDMARMLYNRDTSNFRYLLLFGDGSFDHKDIYGLGNNVLPTYQQESFNPLYAFPADDYYSLVTAGNTNPLRGSLKLAVGRIPISKTLQAQQMVNKIIQYDQNPSAFQEWRNRMVFVADDEDSNLHLIDADKIADDFSERFPAYNLNKIYLDAFPQVSTPGGNRFPDVTEALNQAIFQGSLVVTYLGHGGENGWAQERVLNISDIQSWDNINQMPLLMTATCSFTGYDDPTFVSAGEEAFLNPKGGAFALMTTVRAVFANQNADLTEETLDQLFIQENGRFPTLGEAMIKAKNNLPNNSVTNNSRKFTLIGDPAQHLAIPEYTIKTSSIDGRDIEANQETLDTLGALQRVKITGEVVDVNGNTLSGFNGIIYPSVFDKKLTLKTLGQDQGSRVREYEVQQSVIFKGRASVQNGRFEFTFIVPKDINYTFGPGKISYYASDGSQLMDANGDFENIIIGGSRADEIDDNEGPLVDVFMNTEDFVFGGITDANPTLLVKLEDDFGINVVGNSIGHDLEAILDDDSQNAIVLNDFFQSELNDFTKGEVRFPLEQLEEGLHSIRVKAWDVANNSSEGYTEFLVAESEGFILEHVLNYPNPFTDRTCFQFDHNNAGQNMDVLIQIFTVSGRLVKTLEANLFSDGAIRQDDCIEWDGRDDFGDPLAKGVYLYKVKVRANILGGDPIKGESTFQKLVLLK